MPITGQKTTVPFISTPNVSVSNVQNQDLLIKFSNLKIVPLRVP